MMELDFTNEVTINELVQICKIVKSKKAKQDFLEKIANKLTKENYTSLNQTLKEDIKDLFRETYNNDVFVLLERVFQQPSAQNIVIQVIPDNQNQPNIISKNQGEVENVKHNTSQRLDFSDLSFNNATCSSSAVNFAIQQDDDVSGDVNLNTNNELIRTEELVPDTQLVQKTTSASETGNSEHNTMSSIEDDGRNPVNSKRTIKRKLQLNKPSSSKEFSSIAQEEELKKKKQRMELQLQESRIENKLVNVISHKSSVNSKFKCKITETVFKFQNTPLDVSNFPVYLNKAFEEILTFLIKDAHPHHKIAIKMCLPDFSDRKPIGIPFTTISELKSNAITSVLGSVPQSATNFKLTDLLEVSSKILEIPYGKGRTNLKSAPTKTFLKLKIKSLVNVQLDNDIYCLPVALIFGKCIADNDKNKIRSFKRSKALLKKEVLKLNKLANINTDEHFGTNLVQLAAYQKALPKYNIIVFNDKRNFRNRLFNNTNRIQGKTNLNIAYFEDINHFTGIRNVRKFFNKRFQCDICLELYDRKNGHSCNEKCKSCEMAPPCDTSSATIYCNDCNRYFYGAACLEAHYISICAILKYCTTCSKLIDMRKRNFLMHSCDEKVCPICTNIVDRTHCCYVQKYKHQAPSKFSIIFYDLKCTHNLNMGNDTYFHKPNLCVAHIVCNNCFMFPMSDYCCTICNNRQHIFENNNEGTCVEQFLNFCELYLQHSISIFCIAHNFKAYDGQFILRGLVKRGKDVRPITGGMRIFRITYDYRIHFIDSLNFLPIPLSKFPDTFVLDNISKGWYPHLFNTLDNYNYIGSVPDKKYFGTGHMSEKELERFNIWYEERSSSGLPYDNRKELIEYCTQDVEILRRGYDDVNCDVNLNTNNELIRTDDLVKDTQLVQKRMSTSDTADSEYNSISIIESESEVEEVQGNETIENVGENSPENSEFQNFSLISNKVIFNTTFKVQTAVMAFKFKNIPTDITKLPNFLDNVFCGILSFITRKALSHHKIGLKIVLPNLNPVKSIHFTEVSQLDPNAIASVLKVSGSNYLITETLEIISTILQIPCGKGRTARPVSSKQLIKHKVKSVIDLEIESSPIYCLPVAILLAICLVENHKNKIRLYKRNVASLMKDVDDLNRKANITISRDCGAALTDLPSYQNALPQYNIIVFNDKTNFRKLVFCGDNSAGKRLNIFYFEDISHFVALRNVRTFFDMRYQCANCFELYNVRNKHKCSNKCKSCEAPFPCKTKNPKIRCDLCNRSFYGPICFANHKASVCTVLRFCIVCAKLVDRRQEGYKIHSCNESTCPVCLKVVNTTHRCYIQKYKEKRPDVFSIIFYKLECTQNRKNERAAVLDEPNLCVAHIVCNECIMIPQMNYKCPKCVTTKRKHIFETSYKEKCIKQFIDFCETVRRNFAIVFCVAHNFKVYEGHFILKELLSRNLSLNPIMGGMTIYKITYDDQIIFIDSLNFLPMPLSEFPDAFSLENVAIGWYPHLFNTRENYTYIGKFPERKYFNLALMSVKECDQFNKWYEHCSKLKGRYNNRENLIKYCNRDVDVLRRGCVSFMGSFTAITALNPLVQTISLSQAVMDAYRKQFLLENTLSIVPTNLYRISKNKKPSQLALKWLAYENNSRTDKGKIEYDVKIPNTQLYVDGFCEGQKTIYEFLECYLNGCKECFLNRGQNLIDGNQDKFDTRLDQVNLKIEYLESLGYRVAKIWECHFKKFLKLNPHVANSLKNDAEVLNKHLNPKDAIYGGRTETFQMYYKVKPDEKICYYEFNSLNPYIMKTGKSPLDHPKIHDKVDCKSLDISNMDGLIKCSILPPQDLLIPVLPIKINNEIVFALCRTCAEENISSPCRHNDSERMLIGTWVLDEVKLATKNSYKIHEIFEIWEYKVAQYKVNGGLFTEYMNFLLKLQQEANDWPPNVNLEIEKVQYIQEFFSHEGIQLDALQIKNNPFLKQFCKLALDAFASKFIEGNNTSQTAIIYTTLELYAFASSPGILITDLVAIDDVLWVSWQYSKDVSQLENVSLPVGAFTTANARIKLYNELDKISNQVLYCDTDAIIFVENVNNKGELETGNFIGDLTNKLSEYGKNAFITEFASTGPNCFTYIVFDPDKNAYFEIAMCNGVKLQVNSKNILDLCSLISMGQNNDEEFRVVHDKERNKKRKVVKNVSESNMFGTK